MQEALVAIEVMPVRALGSTPFSTGDGVFDERFTLWRRGDDELQTA